MTEFPPPAPQGQQPGYAPAPGQQPYPQPGQPGQPPYPAAPTITAAPEESAKKKRGLVRNVIVVVGALVVVGIGVIANLGTKEVTELKAGDCVTKLEESDSVSKLPVVDCAKPHQGEVYFAFQLPSGDYPGDQKVQKDAEDRCSKEINTYAGAGADEKFDIFYLRPSSDDWSRDRGVTCIATDANKSVTGSIKK
ncbi:septum formation family protein [Actinoplanes sp. KI2]|uniref:septum formation family protein n=1 Tax=Actinoplanes sp. KI2 TaxID=2983315 RepID=UPI0021D5D5B7|nr:septum formation family protein [Actinoplanes sp. KI2]MCU7728143.1 septum formation family protein [Actinoplanes sp. KI2]